jgi:hypothetical protein
MKLKLPWIKSKQSTTDREIVTLFKNAIDAIATGSKPWELDALRDAIQVPPFSEAEQKVIKRHLDDKKDEVAADILNAELTKILVGAQEHIEDIGVKVRTLGQHTAKKVTVSVGQVSAASGYSNNNSMQNTQNMHSQWKQALEQQALNQQPSLEENMENWFKYGTKGKY